MVEKIEVIFMYLYLSVKDILSTYGWIIEKKYYVSAVAWEVSVVILILYIFYDSGSSFECTVTAVNPRWLQHVRKCHAESPFKPADDECLILKI